MAPRPARLINFEADRANFPRGHIADGIVPACRGEFFDRQPHGGLDREAVVSRRMLITRGMERPTEEGRESASHDHRIVGKSISLRHYRPSLANRSGTSTDMGNILGLRRSYRAW